MAGFDDFPIVSAPTPPSPPVPPMPPQGGGGDPWAMFPTAQPEAPRAPPAMPPGMVLNPETGQVEDLNNPNNPHVPRGQMSAAGLGVGQGVGFGLLDEATGGIAGADAFLRSLMGGGPQYGTPADAYAFGREAMRAGDAQAARSNPGTYIAGLLGGGVLNAAGLSSAASSLGMKIAPEVLAKMPLWQRALTGAAAGGTQGAAYGFGSGEGGFDARMANADRSGEIGAVLGAAAPVIMAAVRPVASAVGRVLGAPFMKGADPYAAGLTIEQALSREGKTADEVTAALQAAQAEGQPMYTVADALGTAGQRALNGVARVPGQGAVNASETLAARQAGQGDRVSNFLSTALDAPDTAAQREAALTAARDTAADTAYAAARANAGPVDVRGALATIDDRLSELQGSGIAGDAIDSALADIRSRLAAANPGAQIPGASAIELSDFERVLGVKRDVQDLIGAATKAGAKNKARFLNEVKDALDSALEAASPAYRAANDEFAKQSAVIRAIEEGSAATSSRVRPEDTIAKIGGLTPDQKAAFSAGYADPLIAKIDSSAEGVNKARPFTSDKMAAELGVLAKDPGLLARQLARENDMFATGSTVMRGSATANNAADVVGAGMLGEVVGQGAFRPVYTAARTAGRILSAALTGAGGLNEATRADVVRALLSNDIQGALAKVMERRAARAGFDALAGQAAAGAGVRTANMPGRQ